MAIVPVSPGQTVEARPTPFVPQNVQFDPNAFGAGVGQATQGLGQAVGRDAEEGVKIATNMAIQNDQNAHKVADTNAEKQATDIGFTSLPGGPDGNHGYFSLKGQDAVTYRPAYQKALDDMHQQISEGLQDSPRAQNWFNQTSTVRAGAAYKASGVYAMDQGIVADNNASAARLGAYKDGLTTNYNDPTALANFQQVTRGEVADTGRRMGWGTDQTAEATTKALSGGYRDAILARATSGDIAGATEMFNSLKPGMDAATQVGLGEHLAPLMLGAQADALVKGLMGAPRGSGASPDIYSALKAQEGPGVSVQGANEGLMPATFKQYAKPGESFDNADDRHAVNRRVIDDLSQKAGGDPARIAVGYFSGPGNMSAPGAALPYLQDKSDANGKTTSSYVADITRRLGNAGSYQIAGPPVGNSSDANPAIHPDFAGMQQKLLDATADNRKLQDAALSRLHTAASQYDLSTQADRDQIDKNWKDNIASATAGNDTVNFNEAMVRHVFRPDVADYMMGQAQEATQAGQMNSALKLATPSQATAILTDLSSGLGPRATMDHLRGKTVTPDAGFDPANPTAEDPAHYVQRQKALAQAQSFLAQRGKMLADDPATYVMQDPNVANAYKALDKNNPATIQAAADASFSTQRSLGVDQPRVLGATQAAQMVKSIEAPNQADMGAKLNDLQNQYGSHYGDVIADLTKAGLSPRYQMLAHANLPEQATVRSDAQAAFQEYDALGKDKAEYGAAIPVAEKKNLEPAIDNALGNYRKTIGASAQGTSVLATTVYPAVKVLAQHYMLGGMSATAAVTNAAGLINKSYSFDDELRVPNGPGMPTVSQVRTSMGSLTNGLQDADLRGTTAAEAQHSGVWFTNGDDKGATMLKGTLQGGYLPVRRADGSALSVDFKNLPKGIVAAPMSPTANAAAVTGG